MEMKIPAYLPHSVWSFHEAVASKALYKLFNDM